MEGFISFLFGVLLTIIIWGSVPSAAVTYQMINKAEQVCYSNHNIENVRVDSSDHWSVTCRNGAKFKFKREDYRNE